MRVLIAGGHGQLGQELAKAGRSRFAIIECSSADLDITDANAVERQIVFHKPDVVINAAAYTAVDKAESEPIKARAVNTEGAGNLAQSCARHGIKMVQVSTDFVFDGQSSSPYLPNAPTHPISEYGKTKRDGELAVLAALPHSCVIVRTAWLYSPGGNNFVSTMLRLMQQKEQLNVVADQIGSPTLASGLAQRIYELIESNHLHGQIEHWTDAGVASWYDFSIAIRDIASEIWPGRSWAKVHPITSLDYPTAAERPKFSVLAVGVSSTKNSETMHWRAQLRRALKNWPDEA